MSNRQYKVHSRAYLSRAYARLNEQATESLFYAAFEFRCGIEARINEYVEANRYVSRKKAAGWKVAPKFKELERVHTANVKCVYVGINASDESDTKVLYFTPVNSELVKYAQKLGDCLHVQQSPPKPTQFREWLETIAQELRIACSGTLLTPPLMKNDNPSQIEMNVEFRTEAEAQKWYANLVDFENITVNVEYVNSPPEEYLGKMDQLIFGN